MKTMARGRVNWDQVGSKKRVKAREGKKIEYSSHEKRFLRALHQPYPKRGRRTRKKFALGRVV